MKISLSTIKIGKVYSILYSENPVIIGVTKAQFESVVIRWAHVYFDNLISIFTAIEPDLLSMVVIVDINNDHEDAQIVLDI